MVRERALPYLLSHLVMVTGQYLRGLGLLTHLLTMVMYYPTDLDDQYIMQCEYPMVRSSIVIMILLGDSMNELQT